jgi:hypothetical protein
MAGVLQRFHTGSLNTRGSTPIAIVTTAPDAAAKRHPGAATE